MLKTATNLWVCLLLLICFVVFAITAVYFRLQVGNTIVFDIGLVAYILDDAFWVPNKSPIAFS